MKKKMKLNELTIKSFVTGSDEILGGIVLPLKTKEPGCDTGMCHYTISRPSYCETCFGENGC